MKTLIVKTSFAMILLAFVVSSNAAQYNDLVTVGAGQVLEITENTTFMKGLAGEGTVRNSSASTFQLIFKGGTKAAPVTFAGTLEGKLDLTTYGAQYFTSTASSVTGGPEGYQNGTLGFTSLDVFTGNFVDRTGLRILYLGNQACTCAKNLTMMNSGNGIFEMDAGAYGGMTFTGTWNTHLNVPWQRQIVLTGSNSVQSVFAGQILRRANANSPTGGYSCHVIKDGTGTWKFCKKDPASGTEPFSGAMTIKNGTLRFDSLAERGENCALGTALDLFEAKNGTGDDPSTHQIPNQVSYAYLVGSETGDATFEFDGTAPARSSTRPLAVKTKARLRNNTAYDFAFGDIYPSAAGMNTLTLDGDNAVSRSMISGLNDRRTGATGDLSIVKDGTGTWEIVGESDIHGSVSVKKGTLVLRNKYTWYRFNVKATVSYNSEWRGTDTGLQVVVEELGLYASDGTRLNKNLAAVTTYPNLNAGEIANGFVTGKWTPKEAVGNIAYLCDDTASAYKQWYYLSDGWYDTDGTKQTGGVIHWHPTKSSTWYPIVMRLADDTQTVAGYDVATSGAATTPSIWSVEASMDGVNWTTVEPDHAITATRSGWQMAGRAHAAGSDDRHLNGDGLPDMKVFSAGAVSENFLTNVTAYSVSEGATLKIVGDIKLDSLVVDPKNAGTIEGGSFAESGTLAIESDEKLGGPITLPLDVSEVGNQANLSNWSLTINGKPKARPIKVVDGKIEIAAFGMVIMVR